MTNPRNPKPQAPAVADLQRLADIPAEIQALERTINGLKTDKDKQERRVDASKARHQLAISKGGEYSNAEDRRAALLLALEDDPKHAALTERLESIRGMIRASEANRDLLRREREALRVKLEHSFADRLEAALNDKNLTTLVGARLLA